MIGLSACPKHRDLEQFSLGLLSEPDGEFVALHLETCTACATAAKLMHGTDPFVQSLRADVSTISDPLVSKTEVESLISRIKALKTPVQAIDVETQFLGKAAQSSAPSNSSMAPTDEILAFLAPAQCADEMGRLGPYRVIRVLGAGGMGLVFHAEDPHLKRAVALKVMKPSLAANSSARERFLREAQAAAAIEHDNVVPIHHVAEDRGVPFLAMPLLRGESLDDRLRRATRLPLFEIVQIGREAALGLAAAHAKGLIHRDIKPGNLWLETLSTETGSTKASFRVRILDFGLARQGDAGDANLTASGIILGTPAYMSPEQARGESLDARADLFSLGCVLYRLCTGQLPFKGKDVISTLFAVTKEHPKPPAEVPPPLATLVMRLLAKDPAERPASAMAVVEMLEKLEPGTSSAGPSVSPPRSRRRRWLPLAAAAGVIALAVILAAAHTWQRLELERGGKPAAQPKSEPPKSEPQPVLAYQGHIDVFVSEKGNGARQLVHLRDPIATPLKLNDEIRIQAMMNEPAYFYIIWVDTEGKAQPVYPWIEGDWSRRSAHEEMRKSLSLPHQEDQCWEMAPGPPGMETLLLLARPTLLPNDLRLDQVLGQMAVPPLEDSHDVAWFDNGELRQKDKKRAANMKNMVAAGNPIIRQQAQLWEKLRPHFPYMTSVTFGNLGK